MSSGLGGGMGAQDPLLGGGPEGAQPLSARSRQLPEQEPRASSLPSIPNPFPELCSPSNSPILSSPALGQGPPREGASHVSRGAEGRGKGGEGCLVPRGTRGSLPSGGPDARPGACRQVVKVFGEDGACRSLEASAATTARQLCETLVRRTRALQDHSWALVELHQHLALGEPPARRDVVRHWDTPGRPAEPRVCPTPPRRAVPGGPRVGGGGAELLAPRRRQPLRLPQELRQVRALQEQRGTWPEQSPRGPGCPRRDLGAPRGPLSTPWVSPDPSVPPAVPLPRGDGVQLPRGEQEHGTLRAHPGTVPGRAVGTPLCHGVPAMPWGPRCAMGTPLCQWDPIVP